MDSLSLPTFLSQSEPTSIPTPCLLILRVHHSKIYSAFSREIRKGSISPKNKNLNEIPRVPQESPKMSKKFQKFPK